MDIDEIKKLSQDKIEAHFLTRIVRRNIKRKEREKQDAREAFIQLLKYLLCLRIKLPHQICDVRRT